MLCSKHHWLAFWMLLLPWSLTFKRLPAAMGTGILLLWTSLSSSIKEGCVCVCAHAHPVTQPCPTRCNPMDCSLPGFSVHGVFHAGILEWVVISTSDLPNPRIGPASLAYPPLEGGFFTTAPPGILLSHKKNKIMTFCNNVNGPRSYQTKWIQTEKDKYHTISLKYRI